MLTVKEWTESRPSSGKASGVAEGIRGWEQSCTQKPTDFKTREQFVEAIEACNALEKAFLTATAKIKDDSSSKVPGTLNLIKQSMEELKTYREKCTELLDQKAVAMEAAISRAEVAAAAAREELLKLETMAVGHKERISRKAEELGDSPKGKAQEILAPALKELKRWQQALENLGEMAQKQYQDALGDKDVTYWRLQGALKITRAFCQPQELVATLAVRFQEFSNTLNDLDHIQKRILYISDEQGLLIGKLQVASDNGLDEVESTIKNLEKLDVTIEKRLSTIKTTISKATTVGLFGGDKKSVDKLYKEQGLEGISKQRHGCQSQIDQLSEKIERLETFTKQFKSLVDGEMKKTPKEHLQIQAVKSKYEEIFGHRKKGIESIDNWIKQAKATIVELEKYQGHLTDKKYK